MMATRPTHHFALPDGMPDKLRAIADAVGDVTSGRMHPEMQREVGARIQADLERIARWTR